MGIFMFLVIIAIALLIAKKSNKIVKFYIIGIIVIWIYFAYIGFFGGIRDSQVYGSWIIFSLFFGIFWLLYNIFKNGIKSSLSEENSTANEFISKTFVSGFKSSLLINILLLVLIVVFGLLVFSGVYRQGDLDEMKKSLITDEINHRKEFLEAVEKIKGKSEDEAKLYVESLEPYFQREKEKFYRYCDGKNLTPYCEIKNNFNEDLTITYRYDKESLAFFHQPPHIRMLKKSDELCSKNTRQEGNMSEDVFPIYQKAIVYREMDGYTDGYDQENSQSEADCSSPISKEKRVKIDPNSNLAYTVGYFVQIKD